MEEILKWTSLPAYAAMYIKPELLKTTCKSDLIDVCHRFLIKLAYTDNQQQKVAIQAVICPIYEKLTGRDYGYKIEL